MVTRADVTELYVATFNRAPDADGLDYWTSSDFTIEMIAKTFFDQEEAQELYPEGTSNESFVIDVYKNLFDRLPDTAGYNYWVDQLDNGLISRSNAILTFITAAQGSDAVILENKAEVGLYYADQGGADADFFLDDIDATEESVEDGKAAVDSALAEAVDFSLTASTDDLVGTSSDDLFDAPITQNEWAGGVSNSLSTADSINGGAGTDTLEVELIPEFYGVSGDEVMEVQPDIQSVEDIRFEAMDVELDAGEFIVVDAKDITDVVRIGSAYSDGDLVIENLTTLTAAGVARNTNELTITMDHTDNFDHDGDASDLTVYFDEDYLDPDITPDSNIVQYEVMNQDAWDLINVDGNAAVELLDGVTFVRFKFTLNGQEYDLVDLGYFAQENSDVDPTGTAIRTHDDLKTTVEAALVDLGLDELITVTIGSFDERDGTDQPTGVRNDVPAVVLTAAPGQTLVADENFVFLDSAPEATIKTSNRYDRADDSIETGSTEDIAINVELDKVGRDGEGGNLVIGGKNLDGNFTGTDSDVDQNDGIQVFNITVDGDDDRPSNLGTVRSTNQFLETANISNGTDWDGADLTIRDRIGGGQELELINATGFSGDFSLAVANAAVSQQALVSNFGAGNDSYDWMSVENDGISSDKDYKISMNDGNDTVTANLDGDSVDTIGESFSLTTGAGNDTVTMDMATGVSQTTMALLHNEDADNFTDYLYIGTDTGKDTVNLDAYGNFNIATGADSDFVRINSVGDNGNATILTTTVGTPTGIQNWGGLNSEGRVLYKAELTVTFAGIESTVHISTSAVDNFVATQLTINEAIKAAIEASPELTKLISATDQTGTQQLRITALVGGENDLSIDVFQPQLVDTQIEVVDGQTVLINPGDVDELRQGILETDAFDASTTYDSEDLETAAEIEATMGTAGEAFYGSVDQTGQANEDSVQELALNAGDETGALLNADGAYQYMNQTQMGTDATVDVNFSTINLGTGEHDLVVMHSNDLSMNTLVIDGSFDKNTVVNFHDLSPNDVAQDKNNVGIHRLDFTAILDNQIDPSTASAGNSDNADSAQDVVVTLHDAANVFTANTTALNDTTATANSVNVLHYDENVADSVDFEDFTQSQLMTKLNDQVAADATVLGGIDHTSLTIAATANLIGTTQNHIFLVENAQNLGEYKVFQATSVLNAARTATASGEDDFSSVDYLGTLDFGYSINFNLVGDADSEALLEDLIDSADNETSVTVDGVGQTIITRDDDLTAPTYAIAAGVDSIDEGGAVTYTVTTTNVADGAVLNYALTGIATDDITADALTGNVTINGGTGTFTVTTTEDATTEGAETLVAIVAGASDSVVINDTSLTPDPTVPTYALAADVDSVDEGGAITYTVTTTNVTDGTVLDYALTGIATDDITADALTGNVTITGGTGTFTVTTTEDATTEGAETLVATIKDATDSVVINDTSVTSTGTPVAVTAEDNGTTYTAVDTAVETFTIDNSASYTYNIQGFELGVDIIDMPDGTTINNTALDGVAGLQWASDGVVVEVNLVGLTDAQDQLLVTTAAWGDSLI